MKIIGMILDKPFPSDIRVEKEVKELVRAGFEVHLLCLHQRDKRSVEKSNGIVIHRKLKKNIVSKVLNRVFFIKYCWLNTIKKFIAENNIDILHIHDLPMVASGLEIKKSFPNIKVVADLHENYPAAVEQWLLLNKDIKTKIMKVFSMNYKKLIKHEQDVLSKVDHTIAVVDEMKERIVSFHNINPNNITVVSNLEDIDFFEKSIEDDDIINKYSNSFTILYIGGFGIHRGLDTAIKGMQFIDIPNLKLLLVGRGSPVIENYFNSLIRTHNLEEKVEILGWQPFQKVYSFMKSSNICIIPHNSNEHTDNTIPHKLYQYMMVEKPIVVSSCKPLARVVNEAQSGVVFKANDDKDFASKINFLIKNPEKCQNYAKNGANYTFKENNTWQNESKKLINLYKVI